MVTTGAAVEDRFSLQLTLVLFLSVVVVSLFTALLTAPQRDEISEFYLGDRTMTPLRNGLAMCGDYLSVATLLGSTGLVALTGYDGLLYLCGTAVAWMMVLLLIAEPLRNAGRFTLGDTLALRLPRKSRPVRLALALCTLTIATLYLVAQARRQRSSVDPVHRRTQSRHPHPVRRRHRHHRHRVRRHRGHALEPRSSRSRP
ncbi:Cation/acetate symporter ActP [Streptomyces alboniger]